MRAQLRVHPVTALLVALIFAWNDPQGRRNGDFGAVHEHGRIKRLLQRHGVSRHKRQLDVFPVATGEIFEDAPALKPGFSSIFWKYQPVSGFPDGGRHDIAETSFSRALTAQAD